MYRPEYRVIGFKSQESYIVTGCELETESGKSFDR